MNIFYYFRYASILSTPIFLIIYLYVTSTIHNFSFSKITVSKTILHIKNPQVIQIFRLNFVLKAFFDSLFYIYLIDHYDQKYLSIISFSLFGSAFLFGLLSIFVEGKYSIIHGFIVYISGFLWALGFCNLIYKIGDIPFLRVSLAMIIIPVVIGFIALLFRKTTILIQAICVGIWYIWIIFFVFGKL